MGIFRDISNRFKRIDLMDILDTVLMELEEVITGFNKEQLAIGQDATGSSLMDYASQHYAAFKVDRMRSDAPLGTPDLKLSGDFYKGFRIILKNTTFEISSTDVKTLQLEGKYGDIFGLQSDSIAELSQRYVKPRMVYYIRKYLEL